MAVVGVMRCPRQSRRQRLSRGSHVHPRMGRSDVMDRTRESLLAWRWQSTRFRWPLGVVRRLRFQVHALKDGEQFHVSRLRVPFGPWQLKTSELTARRLVITFVPTAGRKLEGMTPN